MSKRVSMLVGLAALVVILAGLKLAREVMVPVLVGVMVAATASPIVTFLLNKRVPPILVAVIALTIDMLFVIGFGAVLVMAATDLQAFIPQYTAAIDHADQSLSIWLSHHGATTAVPHPLPRVLRGDGLSDAFAGVAGTVAGVASSLAMVVLVAFFTLCEVTLLGDKLRAFTTNADEHFTRINAIIAQVQRYLVVKFLVCAVSATASYIVLRLCHIDLALMLALIIFVLHFIPNIGPLLAMIPAIGVALLTRGFGTAMIVFASLQSISIFCGNLLEPKLLGRTLGLSPLTVLIAMLFWGWMWGPIGAVLAVPITSVMKIVLENSKGLEPIARMLETAPDLSPPSSNEPAITKPMRITKHPLLRRPTYIIGNDR